MDKVEVALIQMSSGPDIEANMASVESMVRKAARGGAHFVLTPENTCHMRNPGTARLQSSSVEDGHPVVARFSALAKELKIYLLLGSIGVKTAPDRIANRSYLFNSNGDIVTKYDKIHLFDVKLPNGDEYRESDLVAAGNNIAIGATDFGKVGLTVCYDMRFAYLYRALAKAGAGIITVPSAFTVPTGRAHWETLLRARAIETGCFILAPAQTGTHEGGRETWGHSIAIDPWGTVLGQLDRDTGILKATLNLAAIAEARNAIPALQHDRAIKT